MQFIYNGITLYNEPGLIVTFEEFPQQYYRDAASFGWDFKALEEQGKLRVIMTSPEVSKQDLESVGGMIETMVAEMGVPPHPGRQPLPFRAPRRTGLELRSSVSSSSTPSSAKA